MGSSKQHLILDFHIVGGPGEVAAREQSSDEA